MFLQVTLPLGSNPKPEPSHLEPVPGTELAGWLWSSHCYPKNWATTATTAGSPAFQLVMEDVSLHQWDQLGIVSQHHPGVGSGVEATVGPRVTNHLIWPPHQLQLEQHLPMDQKNNSNFPWHFLAPKRVTKSLCCCRHHATPKQPAWLPSSPPPSLVVLVQPPAPARCCSARPAARARRLKSGRDGQKVVLQRESCQFVAFRSHPFGENSEKRKLYTSLLPMLRPVESLRAIKNSPSDSWAWGWSVSAQSSWIQNFQRNVNVAPSVPPSIICPSVFLKMFHRFEKVIGGHTGLWVG